MVSILVWFHPLHPRYIYIYISIVSFGVYVIWTWGTGHSFWIDPRCFSPSLPVFIGSTTSRCTLRCKRGGVSVWKAARNPQGNQPSVSLCFAGSPRLRHNQWFTGCSPMFRIQFLMEGVRRFPGENGWFFHWTQVTFDFVMTQQKNIKIYICQFFRGTWDSLMFFHGNMWGGSHWNLPLSQLSDDLRPAPGIVQLQWGRVEAVARGGSRAAHC